MKTINESQSIPYGINRRENGATIISIPVFPCYMRWYNALKDEFQQKWWIYKANITIAKDNFGFDIRVRFGWV